VRIARGSLYETKYWLHRAHKRGLLTRDQFMELMPLADQLAPSLNAYLNSIGKKPQDEQQPAAGEEQPATN
jgi:four helix bundle protein